MALVCPMKSLNQKKILGQTLHSLVYFAPILFCHPWHCCFWSAWVNYFVDCAYICVCVMILLGMDLFRYKLAFLAGVLRMWCVPLGVAFWEACDITGDVTIDHLLQMSTHVYADKLLFFLSKLVSYRGGICDFSSVFYVNFCFRYLSQFYHIISPHICIQLWVFVVELVNGKIKKIEIQGSITVVSSL